MLRLAVAALPLVLAAGVATAAPGTRGLDYVVVKPAPPVFAAGPDVLFLDRCVGGCTARAGKDDAVAGTSSILGRDTVPATVNLAAFRWGDDVWDAVVACVRDTYAPYDVTVVTERPAAGPYVRVMVAGEASALGLPGNTLGVAPLTSDCSAQPSAIAYAFANAHQAGAEQALEICATAAHEAGHVYGLDHEYECKDPMTYLVGCGAKVFLNKTVACGEFDGPRACKCGATQSSFRKLTEVLGAGAAPAGPALSLVSPTDGGVVPDRFSVFVRAGGRPLSRAELWVNGAAISTVPGKVTDAPYELKTPTTLADGVQHLAVRAYDDLGRLGVLAATVRKGAACTSASCPTGLTCDATGACVAPAGTLAVGAACTSDSACASQWCAVRGDDRLCAAPCWPLEGACDGDLTCQPADDERLACLPPLPEAGGCCSTGGAPTGAVPLTGLVAGLLLRRRRRR